MVKTLVTVSIKQRKYISVLVAAGVLLMTAAAPARPQRLSRSGLVVSTIQLPPPARAGAPGRLIQPRGGTRPGSREFDASMAPEVTGPIKEIEEKRQCAVYRGDGETLARGSVYEKLCIFFYVFDPLAESDLFNNYGIVWIQALNDVRDGPWTKRCMFRMVESLLVPKTKGVIDPAPAEAIKVTEPKKLATELVSDANGNALTEVATLKQTFPLQPGAVSKPLVEDAGSFLGGDGWREIQWAWGGETDEPVGFAAGITLSWPIFDEPLPLAAEDRQARFGWVIPKSEVHLAPRGMGGIDC